MGTGRLVPVDLAHALLHGLQTVAHRLPVGLLFRQDLFGSSYAHRSEEVESLRCGTFRGLAVIVHHLQQHFSVGLVALWHHVDLVVTGLLKLGAYACLCIADFRERTGDLGDGLLVVYQVLHLQSGLLYLGHHLHQTEIV